ncbi:MAG: hypothetical protein U9O82_13035 [Thermodesulfobacteriota bacterium]|nr:hypothetical protein [Thermodesulfobacteriota bacterium]
MGKRLRLGEILIKKGLVTQDRVDRALLLQAGRNRRLGHILMENGDIADNQLLEALLEKFDIPIVNVEAELTHEVKKILPRRLCRKHTVIPLSLEDNNVMTVAMMDPLDDKALFDIESYTGLAASPVVAGKKEIHDAVGRHVPISFEDIFNPQIFNKAAKIASVAAMILFFVAGYLVNQYFQTEKYGTISVVSDSKIFKNHDLMVGFQESGAISLLGRGAYSNGFFSVTFHDIAMFTGFLEKKRENFSDTQYDWLYWVADQETGIAI